MTPVFPDRMVAGCAHGHAWPVEVAWTPLQLELPPECGLKPVEHVQVPTPQPRYCAQCFLDRRGAQPALFLRQLSQASTEAL